MDELALTAIGVAGIFLLLLAFILNYRKKVVRYTYTYNGLNFLGAGLLAFYAIEINAPVFAALQAIWMLVALYFITQKARENK